MKLNKTSRQQRAGFTLIELLVVIGIIAVLAAIIIPAAMKILGKGPELQARTDIQELNAAVSQFKSKFGVDYLPSRFILKEDGSYDTTNALERDSLEFLNKMFGNISFVGMDWNGNGQIDSLSAGWFTLEGDQCLVFFLGGIPTGGPLRGNTAVGTLGFSTNKRNPTAPGGERLRFFDFPGSRLRDRRGQGFYSFVDPFRANRPYAYFTTYGRDNNYNKYGSSDCAGLNVSPYLLKSQPPEYHHPRGFQIISAGKDGTFGPGGLWDPATGGVAPPGADDMSNFHVRVLGAP